MNLFRELCRRNVFKVGAIYVVSSWLLLQIADLVIENVDVPTWVMPAFMLVTAIGLPVVIIAAWMVELTPHGLRLVKNVPPGESIASNTGRQLARGFIMILAMAVVLFLTDKFRDETWFSPEPGTDPRQTSGDGRND